jgi:hypothetical protein
MTYKKMNSNQRKLIAGVLEAVNGLKETFSKYVKISHIKIKLKPKLKHLLM